VFLKPLREQEIVGNKEIQSIFCDSEELLKQHRVLLSLVKHTTANWGNIGQVFLEQVPSCAVAAHSHSLHSVLMDAQPSAGDVPARLHKLRQQLQQCHLVTLVVYAESSVCQLYPAV